MEKTHNEQRFYWEETLKQTNKPDLHKVLQIYGGLSAKQSSSASEYQLPDWREYPFIASDNFLQFPIPHARIKQQIESQAPDKRPAHPPSSWRQCCSLLMR
mgnify:CR=1 FL=1